MVGKTNGKLTVLSLDKTELFDTPHKHRKYTITVKCLACGKIFQTTWNNFRATCKSKTKSCKFCKGKTYSDNITKETGMTPFERGRLANIKHGAKKRNISYNLLDLKVKELINLPCFYCGKEKALGIDRIDSSKGYEEGNVVPCCHICNMMKNKYSLDFFKSHICSIYKNLYET